MQVRVTEERVSIDGRVFRNCIQKLINSRNILSTDGLIGQSDHIVVLEVALHMMIEEILHVNRMTYLTGYERRIAEIVILHKLERAIRDGVLNACRDAETLRVLIGVMIQQCLTLTLLELSTNERLNMLYWGKRFHALDQRIWSNAFVGAASVARTILAACRLGDVRVYMPTAIEDMKHSIDLFVVDGANDVAISVKTVGRENRFAATVARQQHPGQRSGFPLELNNIYTGAAWASRHYNRPFYGLHVAANCAPEGGDIISLEGDSIALYYGIQLVSTRREPETESDEKTAIVAAS